MFRTVVFLLTAAFIFSTPAFADSLALGSLFSVGICNQKPTGGWHCVINVPHETPNLLSLPLQPNSAGELEANWSDQYEVEGARFEIKIQITKKPAGEHSVVASVTNLNTGRIDSSTRTIGSNWCEFNRALVVAAQEVGQSPMLVPDLRIQADCRE